MTCKEKLKAEHPECISPDYIGGCDGCPYVYGWLDVPPYCNDGDSYELCEACWNREIPEEKKIKKEEKNMHMVITETSDGKIIIDIVRTANIICDMHKKFTNCGFTIKESYDLINKLLDAQLRCLE